MVSVQGVFVLLLLCAVQCLQYLCSLLFPPATALLGRLVSLLEARRREALARLKEARYRACADRVAVAFVEERNDRYTSLKRYGDVGSRHKKFWYQVTSAEGQLKMLTVAPLPKDCPLALDRRGLETLNTLLRKIQHPLLQSIDEVAYYSASGCVVTVQQLYTRGSLKDFIHKASPSLGWSAKYDKYGRSAVKATSGALRVINSLSRNQHPLLSSIHGVHYCPDSEQLQLVIVEDEGERSSLSDLLRLKSPTKGRRGPINGCGDSSPFSSALLACYGHQILEAVLYLYDLGLRPLAHLHAGNIFLEGGYCRLGGFENRLLGYKPRLYEMCEISGIHGDLDALMFGHVFFEMASGHEVNGVVPGEKDYQLIKHQAVREILQVIFKQDDNGKFMSSIKEISTLPFFQQAHLPSLSEKTRADCTSLTSDLRDLLSAITGPGEDKVAKNSKERLKKSINCSIQ